ncbi:hypothetical protein FOZ60_000728, partial [Perkinsus olseni]
MINLELCWQYGGVWIGSAGSVTVCVVDLYFLLGRGESPTELTTFDVSGSLLSLPLVALEASGIDASLGTVVIGSSAFRPSGNGGDTTENHYEIQARCLMAIIA